MESAERGAREFPVWLFLGALATSCVAFAVVAKEHGPARGVTSANAMPNVDGSGQGEVKEVSASERESGEIQYPNAASEEPSRRAERLGLGSAGVASAVLRGELSEAWIAEAGGDVGSGTLAWPVLDGWRVRGFGSGEDGYHKAIDIGGELGWSVHAADDGVVVYAGDEIPGYGEIVMIVHKGRFATFYAHLSELLVTAGQRVMRAEIIGEIGSTGISRGPHLHFELIHDSGNCDPEPLFRPEVRGLDGEQLNVEQAHWDGRGSPPAAVRCEQRPSGHPDSQSLPVTPYPPRSMQSSALD